MRTDSSTSTEPSSDADEHHPVRTRIQRYARAFLSPIGLLLGLFVLSLPFVTPYLRGDGVGYYAWIRSPVIDHDLQFENEYKRGDPLFKRAVFDRGELKPDYHTSTGHTLNHWGVGSAVVWAPFFVAGHLVALGLSTIAGHVATNGYSLPYLWFTAFGSASLAFLSLVIACRVATRTARPWAVFTGALTVWGASSLLVYQYFLPFWPWAAGAFAAALLVWVWREEGWGFRRWIVLGLVGGLLASIHPVAAGWLALPAASLLGLESGRLGLRVRAGLSFAFGAVVSALPQLIGKWIVVGAPWRTGYGDEFDPFRPHPLRALVGADHGLISWTPVAAVALLGIAWPLWRKDRRLAIGLLAAFFGILYLVACHTTHEQSSFGNRFFVLYTPGFVIGAAALAERCWNRRAVVIPIAAVLVVWNLLFMFQWAWGLTPKRGAVEWGRVARNQFTVAPREAARAARLFATNRAELLRIVQQRDLERLEAGEG